RTQQLRGRFGPEYERTVREFGNRRAAEAELQRRVHRTTRYAIRDLPPHERDWFAEQWRIEQARFVDEPGEAVTQVHRLVNEVMKARGYPVSAEFERNAEDVSADHPMVVEHYRLACDIAERHQRGEANTEDLRKAMVNYRALFEELLGARVA